ncbi:MAG TPA: glycosyl hydrolase [Acidimicrobiales bacterium]|nr:glycosyl hydrolase [Acidimicrobiales bacterium]
MRHLRRAHVLFGLPKEIAAVALVTAVALAATGTFSPPPRSHPAGHLKALPEAGGGGAFVPSDHSTTTTTTSTMPPPTTTEPPAAAVAPATTAPPAGHASTAGGGGPTGSPPPTTAPPAPPVHHIPAAAAGVYSGSSNPAGAAGFARATGAHVAVVEDYLPGGSWAHIDGTDVGPDSLGWLFGPWRGSGYQLVLGVPMFDNTGTDTLAAGAAGAYNADFAALAQTLVTEGEGNAILRLGQEFTGSWNAWRVTNATDAANYAAYYRQIVQTMRPISPGLKFVWEGADPQDGSYSGAYTADQSYPGDAYVDYIGSDTYDQSWAGNCGLAFTNSTTPAASLCSFDAVTLPGLNRVAAFASAHGKPIVFPEWGLAIRGDGHGMGDDPTFIQQMANWISFHNVAFDLYFNFDVSGQVDAITDGRFPASLATYQADFG